MSGDRYSKSLVNEKWNGDQRNMNNKNFNMVCPNCKGKMVIDRDNGCLRCLHCDTEIPLDESDDVVIERIRNNAKLRSEINRNETNKTIQKMQGKVEIEKSKHKVTRLFIMAFIIVVLIGAYAGWRIVHRIDNYQEEMSHRDKIQITSTVSDFEGKRFSDMAQRSDKLAMESGKLGLKTVLGAFDHAVAEAVAALVRIQLGFHRHPARIPDSISIFDVVVTAAEVHGAVVVAVAGQAQQLGVFVEAIASGRIADEAEEVLASQIVDPRQRRFGGADDIFLADVIEMSKLHKNTSLFERFL